jgi:hypothetical protein
MNNLSRYLTPSFYTSGPAKISVTALTELAMTQFFKEARSVREVSSTEGEIIYLGIVLLFTE